MEEPLPLVSGRQKVQFSKNFALQSMALSRKVIAMPTRSDAEEHLRIIRSLMEKATIYRAISAPGAMVGGVLAVGLAVGCWRFGGSSSFVPPWLALLAVTAAVNAGLLWKDARRRGEVFVSTGMKVALRAMIPGLIAGGLCTLIETDAGAPMTATLWVLCYGVSLLAASHFAPKSIQWLGRAFFVAGALLLMSAALLLDHWRGTDLLAAAHAIMGVTFGGFHLAYAALVWPRRGAASGTP